MAALSVGVEHAGHLAGVVDEGGGGPVLAGEPEEPELPVRLTKEGVVAHVVGIGAPAVVADDLPPVVQVGGVDVDPARRGGKDLEAARLRPEEGDVAVPAVALAGVVARADDVATGVDLPGADCPPGKAPMARTPPAGVQV